MRGHGHADRRSEAIDPKAAHRKPASRVKQIAAVIANVGQLQPRNRAVVAGFELPFVFESQGRGCVFRQPGRQWHAHRRILGDPLGRQLLPLFVGHLGDAQVIVQFEDGDREVLRGREFDLGTGRDLMEMRLELRLDLVVVDAQACFFRRPRRRGEQDC